MASAESVTFKAGEVIFREGEVAIGAYMVMTGEVGITVERSGGPVQLNSVGPNQLLGEMALIDDSPRSATATAVTDVELALVTAESFHFWLGSLNPFLRAYIEYLVTRVRELSSRVER